MPLSTKKREGEQHNNLLHVNGKKKGGESPCPRNVFDTYLSEKKGFHLKP